MTVVTDLIAAFGDDEEGLVIALLDRMTLAEKLGQLCLTSMPPEDATDPFNPTFVERPAEETLADVRSGHIGGIFNGSGVQSLTAMQSVAVEETRLGIPLVFAADVIHGFRTIFPVPLAEAASWRPDLARRTARAAAVEASAAGIDWTFAPGMDVTRDPRWGRVVESSGEDALLASRLAEARVRGFQTDDLTRPDAMLATAKHFAGYGAAEGGIDYNTVELSWRSLREQHLPSFRAAVAAGVGAVMASFNDFDGVPCTANRALLSGILREEWGFEGLIVGDYTSDHELIAHGAAADAREATKRALLAGLELCLESGLILLHGADLVATGEVSVATIDRAATRMLRMKARLGLLTDPFRRLDPTRAGALALADHRALAREAAIRSVVMLKNEGGLLPLNPASCIALIGPFACGGGDLNGCWSQYGSNADSVDLLAGLSARFAGCVDTAPGCDVTMPLPGGIDEAVALAQQADVIVLAIGEPESQSGEARSRADIALPEAQLELALRLRATGKPLVTLVRTGRPLPLEEVAALSDALLVTWFLGSETGNAVADIMSGIAEPGGRLPISFPRHQGQIPIYYARKMTGRPPEAAPSDPFRARYLDLPTTPLYPFGHGLGFATFEVSAPWCESAVMDAQTPLAVSVTVHNIGNRTGEILLQLYIRDVSASVVRPRRELKDFRWVRLEGGESTTVTFEIVADQLAFLREDMRWGTEPGIFEVWICEHAEAGVPTRFEFVADGSGNHLSAAADRI